jgi:integral membrane protein (TIGR01906 family)
MTNTIAKLLKILILVGALLFFDKGTRAVLSSGLRIGGVITAGLIAVIGLSAVFAWQAWFVAFHEIFFAQGSWTFNFTDTLIRLFPEKFWIDAATTIASLSLSAGLAAVIFSLPLKLRKERVYG